MKPLEIPVLEPVPPVGLNGGQPLEPAGILASMGLIDNTTVCQILDISPRTLERRIVEGLPVVIVGARRFFSLESLKTWLLSQETARRQPPRRGRPPGRRAA